MRLGRTVLWSALWGLGIVLSAASPAAAQIYEETRQSLGFGQDAIARSPRLAGMGALTVVGDDPHNRITLWDFALNPLGIAEADSVSIFELRPGTSALSAIQSQYSLPEPAERQERAAREFRTNFEGWRRAGGIAYGAIGDLGILRADQPVASDLERRSHFTQPQIMAILNGPIPWIRSGRASYAMRLVAGDELGDAELRGLVSNPIGDYIDRDGTTFPPTNFFAPDEYRISTFGFGTGASYKFGPWLEAALAGDLVGREVFSQNTGDRYTSEFTEKPRGRRPFPVGQATLIGHVGKALEWGLDGRMWNYQAEQRWFFTVSAGIGQDPLSGRGKYSEHEQRGNGMTARLRWTEGPFEVGGSLATDWVKDIVNAPSQDDGTSFNHFLNTVYYRPKADSLYQPDSVSFFQRDDRAWRATGGVAMRLPGRRGMVGVEYQMRQREFEDRPGGVGPREVESNVRVGAEYHCTPVFTGRAGYIYRNLDQDELTQNNEVIGNTLTLGLSLQPTGAMWSLDAGYGIEWLHGDYGDPGQPRGSRQSLVTQLRWTF